MDNLEKRALQTTINAQKLEIDHLKHRLDNGLLQLAIKYSSIIYS